MKDKSASAGGGSSRLQHRPAVAVAVCLAIGSSLYSILPVYPRVWLLVAAASLALAAKLRSNLVLAAAIALVGLTAAQLDRFEFPADHISAFTTDEERFAQIELKVNDSPRLIEPAPGELRDLPPKLVAQATVQRIHTISGWQTASGQILLSVEQINPRLAAGQIVRATGILSRPIKAMNPGEFDFYSYCRDQRILAELRVAHSDGLQIVSQSGPSLLVWLREKSRHLLALGFPAQSAYDHALLRAFVLGDPDPQLQDLLDEFVHTGTVHLFAISGLHVAIIGGLALLACRLLRISPRRSAGIVLTMVCLYAAVALPSWPGWRSVLMGAAACFGFLSRRSVDSIQTFFLAIIVILLFHPGDLQDGGFQVSFAAVLGMILFASVSGQRLLSWWRGPDAIALGPPRRSPMAAALHWVRMFVFQALLAGWVAWMLSMPLVAYHFGQINCWSVPAGVALLPLTIIALVFGVAKIVLSLCWPSAAWMWAAIATQPVVLLRHAVDVLNKLPGSSITASPSIAMLIAYYLLVLIALVWTQRIWLRCASALGAMLVCAGFVLWPATAAPPQDLQLTLLSLGAGQCGILRLPDGHAVFIDTGSSTVSDLARRLIWPYLRQQNCTQIDKIILSHGDFDHISAAVDIYQRFHPPIYMSPHFARHAAGNLPAEALLQTLADSSQPPVIIARGDHLQLDKGVDLDVLWPPVNCDMNSNNCGLVLQVRYAGRSLLFPADIQVPPEEALLKTPALLKSDVLVAPHHGSAEPSTAAFIRAVDPRLILASNDRKLTHKQRLFDTLAAGYPFYRTHRCGAITLTVTADGKIDVQTFLGVGPIGPGSLAESQKLIAGQVSN